MSISSGAASPTIDIPADYADLVAACEALDAGQREQLDELLRRHGIASEYIEYSGNIAHIPLSDRLDILQLKGVDLFTQSALDQDKLTRHIREVIETPWLSPLPSVVVLARGGRNSVELRLPVESLGKRWQWRVLSESGSEFAQDFVPADLPESAQARIDGTDYSAKALSLPPFHNGALQPGYHQLFLRCRDIESSSGVAMEFAIPLIVAPARCHEPQWMRDGQRLWGLSVQLYSLRSVRNWGIGDFGDLRELIPVAAQHGASFLVLNPLHALDLEYPDNCSPYSPNDRRRLNILYIDPLLEPDFCDNAALVEQTKTEAWKKRLRALQERAAIDYHAVADFKKQALVQMFQFFLEQHLQHGTERATEFQRFVMEQGDALQVFANFEAGRHRDRQDTIAEADPRFTLYTQWLAESQLEGCQRLAVAQGMRLGLIRDLAVGGDGGGAEGSLNRGLYCDRASIGAPPDPLAPQGQNWGLPPLDPVQLQSSAYSHFIQLLRTNMAHCGALRIDHVMALMRLWWCPRFAGRGGGAYVHYPVDDLFALLRLESVRNECVVIGEDLGVVPPEVRAYLHSSAVFSNVLFYFEKYDGYHFKRPEHYNPQALAMVANHDVPTLAAWWNCSDLNLRFQLGLITEEKDLQDQQNWRHVEKRQVLQWLADQWLLPEQWQLGDEGAGRAFDAHLCAAIFRCCARSRSLLLSIQLEDLALLETPVNIPGTSTEYPNWRRKLPVDIKELLDSDSGLAMLAGFAIERGAGK
ncbi:MAG: 4-alpha-glucanotransferase [Gammaproteobacteria bacterium RIFCSPLOWO2_02_FULL_57_10]|nr:MAG: 4-alpha-glucanotransferase [Gammaproteobacteria bacterium RIFCSPLOWO2_02_FULL_57_10]